MSVSVASIAWSSQRKKPKNRDQRLSGRVLLDVSLMSPPSAQPDDVDSSAGRPSIMLRRQPCVPGSDRLIAWLTFPPSEPRRPPVRGGAAAAVPCWAGSSCIGIEYEHHLTNTSRCCD